MSSGMKLKIAAPVMTRNEQNARDTKDLRLQTLARLKAQQADLAAQIADAEKRLMETMLDGQQKSLTTQEGGKKYTVTYVQARTTVINEPSLRKAMGAAAYDKYTTKKLDRTKLEKAIEAGEVDPVVVSMHAEEKLSKPFLKFTQGEVSDATTA